MGVGTELMNKTTDRICSISLPENLREAVFIARRNRFVAEIELGGEKELAHVPSSGRMGELLYPGARVYVGSRSRPEAKLKYRILLAEYEGNPVSVDSLLPNRLVYRALESGFMPELSGYGTIRREVPFGAGRFDFYLGDSPGKGCYLEVKSVTLVEGGVSLFPDAPSDRGSRHLEELTAARREGYRAVVLFVIQRADAMCFSPNRRRDPRFGLELSKAVQAGVEALARRCRVSHREVTLDISLPVYL